MTSAWADYLDARVRLVHDWTDAGLRWIEMAEKLSPTEQQIELLSQTPTEPPIPGSSRDQLATWVARARALENEVHATRSQPTMPLRAPASSEVRGLLPHSDPLQCGCQHWTDPPPRGEHHWQCVHGSGVKP